MTELIGHRGYSARYPENTILGFKKAVSVGCDGIELDVRLTKDNKVAVIHDNRLERTTNGKGLVGEYTLKELKKLDAGQGQEIPSLKEVLAEIVDIKLLIELKEYSPKICSETIKLAGKRKNTFFISFSIDAIQNIKKINPRLKTGLIFSKPLIEPEKYIRFIPPPSRIPHGLAAGIHPHTNTFGVGVKGVFKSFPRSPIFRGKVGGFINALCPRVDRLDSQIAMFAKQYKLYIYVWTVDTAIEFKKVMQYGVTGIVTNDPGRIGKFL